MDSLGRSDDRVNASVLVELEALVNHYGGDLASICSKFDIDADTLTLPEQQISCSGYVQLLEYCAETFRAPFFGLELGTRQGLKCFGMLALLVNSANTVKDALQVLVEHQAIQAPSLALSLLDGSDGVTEFRIATTLPGLSHKRQSHELGLAILIKALRVLVDPDFCPLYVRVAARLPNVGMRPIRSFFACEMYYDQTESCVAFPTEVLSQRVSGSNEFLVRLVNDHIERTCHNGDLPIEDQVDKVILALLPSGRCTIKHCATKMKLGERTLQNYLAERGTSFSERLARRRRLLAEEYLRDTQMPTSDIAGALGYADQSTFTRAFAGWTATTPGRFRRSIGHASAVKASR